MGVSRVGGTDIGDGRSLVAVGVRVSAVVGVRIGATVGARVGAVAGNCRVGGVPHALTRMIRVARITSFNNSLYMVVSLLFPFTA